VFLKSLPPAPVTRDQAEAIEFFAHTPIEADADVTAGTS
jgi:hypothetical protein